MREQVFICLNGLPFEVNNNNNKNDNIYIYLDRKYRVLISMCLPVCLSVLVSWCLSVCLCVWANI